MKRFFSLMLILALCAILAGCSASAPDNLKKAWKVDQSSIGYLRQNVEGMPPGNRSYQETYLPISRYR